MKNLIINGIFIAGSMALAVYCIYTRIYAVGVVFGIMSVLLVFNHLDRMKTK